MLEFNCAFIYETYGRLLRNAADLKWQKIIHKLCVKQVRKKEPPHPIRVAKTIDVIARITFPAAYFVFLTFFFIHYKGVS